MLRALSPPHLASTGKRLTEKHPELQGLLFATSGTTGHPKWIIHSQEGLDWCAKTVNEHFDCSQIDTWGLALPEFHVGGYCLAHRASLAKGRLARYPSRWNPLQFQHWLASEKVTITSLVPTQVFDLVHAKLQAPPTLRLALIGGEHLNEHLFEKALALGWPLIISYGMTETAGLVASSQLRKNELHPLPGWDLTVDPNGLLTIDSPGLFKGTLDEQGFHPQTSPFTTKDLVDLSAHTLTIRGRSDHQIKILGELVDLATLRTSLAATLPRQQTTIIALPDERRNFQLFPVIEGSNSQSVTANIAAWNQTLPPFSRCQQPLFIASWPLTPLGKTDLQNLTTRVANERDSLLLDT